MTRKLRVWMRNSPEPWSCHLGRAACPCCDCRCFPGVSQVRGASWRRTHADQHALLQEDRADTSFGQRVSHTLPLLCRCAHVDAALGEGPLWDARSVCSSGLEPYVDRGLALWVGSHSLP